MQLHACIGCICDITFVTGQLRNNQRHGKGRMQYRNGDAYEGMWYKDNRQGSAIYFYANGDVFIGKFDDNRREGLGTIYMVSSRPAVLAHLAHACTAAFVPPANTANASL